MAIDDKLKELFKDKRVLIGAAVIGGVAGLYVLSKSGGAGGGALQPTTPLDPTAPANGDGGGSDTAGLQGQIAELTAGQSSFAAQVSQWIQGLTDSLAASQGQNQSALQSVIDQVNSQLGSGAFQQAQTVPDYAGFLSQLTAGASYLPQQVINPTGQIFKNAIPLSKVNQIGKSSSNILSQVTTPNTHVTQQVYGAGNKAGTATANFLNSLRGAIQRLPTKSKSYGGGVPFNIGQTYLPYVKGGAKALKPPTIKPPKKLYSGGSGLLKG